MGTFIQNKPKALVLTGDGINCEKETAFAFDLAGAQSTIIHINDLLARPQLLKEYQILSLPGGFSFGDELGSGQILGLKLKNGLSLELEHFTKSGFGVIGICNGFQALVKMGLLPNDANFKHLGHQKSFALAPNENSKFINQWVSMTCNEKNKSPWLSGLQDHVLHLPIRHGEGRLVVNESSLDAQELEKILNEQTAFTYTENVNGSLNNIAGITNKSGNILGLMPHPEAALYNINRSSHHANGNTDKLFENTYCLKIFENIVDHLKK